MDSVTHILSAALWSEPLTLRPGVASGRRLRIRTVVTLGALLPDADGVLGWIDPALYAHYHRVVTHSLFVLPLIALLAAWLARVLPLRWVPVVRCRIAPGAASASGLAGLYGFALLAVSWHFTGDWIAAWGIWPFWPLSSRDCALSLVNSLEPALLGFTLGGAACQHLALQRGRRGLAWGIAGAWLLCAVIYVCFRIRWFGPPFI